MFSKISTLTDRLDNIADSIQKKGFNKEAEEIDVVSNTLEKMAKKIPAGSDRPVPVFDDGDSKVKDGKDHFPIPDAAHARNALARVHQYSSAPSWYNGTLSSLQSAVSKAVHAKYPGIKISKK